MTLDASIARVATAAASGPGHTMARSPNAAVTKGDSALSATVPFPKRPGDPAEYASLPLTTIENGSFDE